MPKLDGFEVLGLIPPEIAVVFTTAFDEQAVRAFEVHAVDYLLKPFSAERFSQALTARTNVSRVARLEPWGQGSKLAVLKDGRTVPVSAPEKRDCAPRSGFEARSGGRGKTPLA
jgi:DNA-binding LytR/AlgR family response regulator